MVNGFTENYLEGIPPSWISVGFQALSTYKHLQATDTEYDIPEIDLSTFVRLLESMKPRYMIAGMYMEGTFNHTDLTQYDQRSAIDLLSLCSNRWDLECSTYAL